MKTIGFATKYYTLWEVSKPKVVDYGTHLSTVITHTYIQNLSFDFDKAVEKVKAMDNRPFEVDLELRGARSFNTELSREYNKGVVLFGQFKGKPFEEFVETAEDGYILWYYRSTKSTEGNEKNDKFDPELEEMLINRGLLFKLSDGEVMNQDELMRHVKDVFTKEIYQLGHYGTEGERVTKELTVRSMWWYESMYGNVDVVEMTDMENNLYYVRGSMKGFEEINEGDVVVITGTIAHKEWYDSKLGGQRQETQLKRPNLKSVFS